MKNSATMCRLARAKAITEEPKKLGPVYGYSVSVADLRKIYTRNGFSNLDAVVTSHIKGWENAEMAIRARDRVYFFLDTTVYEEKKAYDRLMELSESMPEGVIVVGDLL